MSATGGPTRQIAITAATATGVQNPAAAIYTQADQTALAAAVAQHAQVINALRAALAAAGVTA